MDNQLEQARDIWVNAFFTGNYAVLAQYEGEHFTVVYERDGCAESSHTRYERIAHAVKNGVWKPKKPDVEYEEFEFNRAQTECRILIGLREIRQQIKEIWRYSGVWKIQELRFLKAERAAAY
jgi:GGDEF domain-containing protein